MKTSMRMGRHVALNALLFRALSEPMAKHGFKAKIRDQSFEKKLPFGCAWFHLSFIPHQPTDFDITADVALRVDAVEKLRNEDNNRISRTQKSQTASIGVELGNLTQGYQRRWSVRDESDILLAVLSIQSAFESTALPYFERFSNLDEMLAVLSRNDQVGSLHAPFDGNRCMTALALAYVLKKSDRIEALITQNDQYLSMPVEGGPTADRQRAFDLESFRNFAGKIRDLCAKGKS
jgi:hypothetical protein